MPLLTNPLMAGFDQGVDAPPRWNGLVPDDARGPLTLDPQGVALAQQFAAIKAGIEAQQARPIWNPDNPVGTETVQSMGMPGPTTYAGPVGQFVDPSTGRMTEQGAARMENPALGLDTGGVGMIKAFHGSPHQFDAFDPTRVGSESMADRWAKGTAHSDEYYLTTNPQHAESYGQHIHEFQIDQPLLEKDAKSELERWAKDEGYDSAQRHIDEYYDGSPYHALDADNYFKDVLREAKEAGLPGARVSFGDLKMQRGRGRVPMGDVIILHDPTAARKVVTP